MRASRILLAVVLFLAALQLAAANKDRLMALFAGDLEENRNASAVIQLQGSDYTNFYKFRSVHLQDKLRAVNSSTEKSALALIETISANYHSNPAPYHSVEKAGNTEKPGHISKTALIDEEPYEHQQNEVYLDGEPLSKKYDSVNGIELTDSPESIKNKLGEPKQIVKDPDLPYLQTFKYETMNIGFSDDYLQYVEIPQRAGSMELGDGTELQLTLDEVQRILGKPDLEAEDGIVYRDGYRVIKFYLDQAGKEIVSAHYFHIYST